MKFLIFALSQIMAAMLLANESPRLLLGIFFWGFGVMFYHLQARHCTEDKVKDENIATNKNKRFQVRILDE